MAVAGPNNAGTVASRSRAKTAWTNPTNAQGAANSTYATNAATGGTDYLDCTNMGWSGLSGVTVSNLLVEVYDNGQMSSNGRIQLNINDTSHNLIQYTAGAILGTVAGWYTLWNADPPSGFDALLGTNTDEYELFADGANGSGWSIDAIRVTVTYTAPLIVTPTTASLTTATFAPTVTVSDHKVVTPGTAAITLATFAPAAILGTVLTPTTASITLATFAPTASLSDNKSVTPATASLALTGYAPSLTIALILTPGTASIVLTGYAPTIKQVIFAGDGSEDGPVFSNSLYKPPTYFKPPRYSSPRWKPPGWKAPWR